MHPYAKQISEIGARANPTFMTLGIEPVSWGNESAVLKMNITERLHNGSGFLQGGFYVILADEAIALAVLSELSENEGTTTITETTEFIRGVKEGEIYASAKIYERVGELFLRRLRFVREVLRVSFFRRLLHHI
mgnify:CR=1 FL=1